MLSLFTWFMTRNAMHAASIICYAWHPPLAAPTATLNIQWLNANEIDNNQIALDMIMDRHKVIY